MALNTARMLSALFIRSRASQPTLRREYRSTAIARYSQRVLVQIYMIPHPHFDPVGYCESPDSHIGSDKRTMMGTVCHALTAALLATLQPFARITRAVR